MFFKTPPLHTHTHHIPPPQIALTAGPKREQQMECDAQAVEQDLVDDEEERPEEA